MRIVTIGTAMALGIALAAAQAAAKEPRPSSAPRPEAAEPVEEGTPEATEDEAPQPPEDVAVPAVAAPAVAGESGGAVLFHWPVAETREDRRGLAISAQWTGTWNGRKLVVHWRAHGAQAWSTAVFQRVRGTMEARIPAADVKVPGLSYWIESIEADGSSRARFGSAENPQRVRVAQSGRDLRRQDRLADHQGRVNRVAATFRHVDFGKPHAADRRSEDNFNELELAFTYRPAMTALYQVEAGFLMVGDRLGVRSPDPWLEHDPGAYLAFVKLYWEFGDVFGLEPMLMLGASRFGLEPGGGMTFRFGALRKTHFDIGIKGARSLGWSFVTSLDVRAAKFLVVRVRNELTNWPTNPDSDEDWDDTLPPYGVVPSLGLAFTLPWGIELNGSVGYGIRKGYNRGWITWSAGAAVEF